MRSHRGLWLAVVGWTLACANPVALPPPSADDDQLLAVRDHCRSGAPGSPLAAVCLDPQNRGAAPEGTVRLGLFFGDEAAFDAALAARGVEEAALAAASVAVLTFESGAFSIGPLTTLAHAPSGSQPPSPEEIDSVRRRILSCLEGRCPRQIRAAPSVMNAMGRSIGQWGQLSTDRAGHTIGRTAAGHGFSRTYDLGWTETPEAGWWVVGVGTSIGLYDVALVLDVPVVEDDGERPRRDGPRPR